jgi:hypothetical protein
VGYPKDLAKKATWDTEKTIDFWYASNMAKANARISQATAMKTAHKQYLNTNELAKAEAFASKLAEVTKAVNNLKEKRRLSLGEISTATLQASWRKWPGKPATDTENAGHHLRNSGLRNSRRHFKHHRLHRGRA